MITGAILAGGGATRMDGRPKGLEKVGGRRVLDRLVDAFQEGLGVTPLLVANAADAAAWFPGLRVAGDLRTGGALSGLYTAVIAAPAPVVCVAWDMPFVPPALLRALAAGLEGADVCVPESGGRRGVEPLCAAYAPGCGAAMVHALDAGDLRAIAFHAAVRVRVLPEESVRAFGDPARIFFNVNTADDLARANEMA